MDEETRYEAVASRDARFDGAFFFAVETTGIYCRPSCPAVTPKRKNVRFYPTAAAAQDSGFRACRRCRPDAVPGSAEWNVRADVVGRAMRMIGDGVVDREGVPGLAGRLGGRPARHRARRRHRTARQRSEPRRGRASRDEAERALLTVPGVTARTAAFIRMRGLGDPDVAPDDGQGRAAWRPWRSYAAWHLEVPPAQPVSSSPQL